MVRGSPGGPEDGVLGGRHALELRRLHKHVAAVRVADRIDVGGGAAEVLVDRDRRPDDLHSRVPEAEVRDIRWPSCRHDDGVVASLERLALGLPGQGDRPVGCPAQPVDPRDAGVHGDTLLDERTGDPGGDRLVGRDEDAGGDVEEGHLAAEGAEYGDELGARVAAADDGDPARQTGKAEDVLGHGRELGTRDRQPPRVAADADEHRSRGDAATAVEHEGVRVDETRPALEDELDARFSEALRLALDRAHSFDGRPHMAHGCGPVDDGLDTADAPRLRGAGLAHDPRRLGEHPGRHAPGVDAGAAGAVGLGDGHGRSEFGRAQSRGGSGRARSDDDDVEVVDAGGVGRCRGVQEVGHT